MSLPSSEPGATTGRLRMLLLALVAFGATGLVVELLLLEHWEAVAQYTPFLTLGAALAMALAVGIRPGAGTLKAFRLIMALVVVAGMAGIGFHLADNLAFEREVTPDAPLGALLRAAFTGATPLLAPGALVQLGLLGLILTYRHPALDAGPRRSSTPPSQETP